VVEMVDRDIENQGPEVVGSSTLQQAEKTCPVDAASAPDAAPAASEEQQLSVPEINHLALVGEAVPAKLEPEDVNRTLVFTPMPGSALATHVPQVGRIAFSDSEKCLPWLRHHQWMSMPCFCMHGIMIGLDTF
jgi:hypothetical protein